VPKYSFLADAAGAATCNRHSRVGGSTRDSRAAEAVAAIYKQPGTHRLGPQSVIVSQFLSGNLHTEKFAAALAHIVVARERVQRKRVAIDVIL
jgi:hypothetical protein